MKHASEIDCVSAANPDDEWAQRAAEAIQLPDADWTWAGPFTVLPDGRLLVPALPAAPGITRMDRITFDGSVAIVFDQHDSMQAEEPIWDDAECAGRLLTGEQLDVFYIGAGEGPDGSPGLWHEEGRREVIRFLEAEAQASGCWILQLTAGERVLVLDP